MTEAFICDAVRTPIGRYGGALSGVRTDDLAAVPLRALMARNPSVDWDAVDDVIYGCANQAGEDNRNVARMALLLAGLPDDDAGRDGQPAVRLGPGRGRHRRARDPGRRGRADDRRRRREHDARAVRAWPRPTTAFARNAEIYDTTIGWRFVNPLMKAAVRRRLDAGDGRERRRGVQGRARRPGRVRAAQPAARARGAEERPASPREIVPVTMPQRKGDPVVVARDEHPRDTTLEALAKLQGRRSARTARSRRATPRASTTARAR